MKKLVGILFGAASLMLALSVSSFANDTAPAKHAAKKPRKAARHAKAHAHKAATGAAAAGHDVAHEAATAAKPAAEQHH
jgi:hypothetical protein